MALLAAACGDDDASGSARDRGSGDETEVELTGDPILVGQIIGIDVPTVPLRDRSAGLAAAVDGFNRHGGVDGRPLELVQCDGQNDPNAEADCAREMVEQGVVATLADFVAANPDTVEETLNEAGIPRIGLTQASLLEYESETVFNFHSGGFGVVAAMFKVLLDEGHERITLVRPDVPAAAGVGALLGPAVEAEGGEIVNEVTIPGGATDYSQFVAAAEANDATAAVAALSEDDILQFTDAAAQLDTELTFSAGVGGFSLERAGSIGDLAEEIVYTGSLPAPNEVEDFPALEQFREDMEASGDEAVSPDQASENALQAWLSVHAFVTLMEGVEDIDTAAVVEAFQTAEEVDMLGLMPPWTPSVRQEGLFANISNPLMLTLRFDGEQFVTEGEPFDVVDFMTPG